MKKKKQQAQHKQTQRVRGKRENEKISRYAIALAFICVLLFLSLWFELSD